MAIGTGYVIAADSTPVLDGWGWGDYWGPSDWITWHKAMVKAFGLDEANHRFITAYGQAGFGASSYDWRTFDSDFKAYAKENGFYDALFVGVGGLIGRVASLGETAVEKTTTTATDVINNAGDAISSVSKIAKYVIPIIVIVVIIAGFFYIRARVTS